MNFEEIAAKAEAETKIPAKTVHRATDAEKIEDIRANGRSSKYAGNARLGRKFIIEHPAEYAKLAEILTEDDDFLASTAKQCPKMLQSLPVSRFTAAFTTALTNAFYDYAWERYIPDELLADEAFIGDLVRTGHSEHLPFEKLAPRLAQNSDIYTAAVINGLLGRRPASDAFYAAGGKNRTNESLALFVVTQVKGKVCCSWDVFKAAFGDSITGFPFANTILRTNPGMSPAAFEEKVRRDPDMIAHFLACNASYVRYIPADALPEILLSNDLFLENAFRCYYSDPKQALALFRRLSDAQQAKILMGQQYLRHTDALITCFVSSPDAKTRILKALEDPDRDRFAFCYMYTSVAFPQHLREDLDIAAAFIFENPDRLDFLPQKLALDASFMYPVYCSLNATGKRVFTKASKKSPEEWQQLYIAATQATK